LDIDELLNNVEIGDVWGVGRKYAKFLRRHNIYTALSLKESSEKWVREKMTITGYHTRKELSGESCLSLEQVNQPRKTIVYSRSFGKPVNDLKSLQEAVSMFISKASEKLRKQKLLASYLMVFVATNKFKKNEPQYFNGLNFRLPLASSYSPELISYSMDSLKEIYKEGYNYKKAGVMMLGLIPEDKLQLNLFHKATGRKESSIMKAFDRINKLWGGGAIKYAAEGVSMPWRMRQLQKSQHYTTRWSNLLKVSI